MNWSSIRWAEQPSLKDGSQPMELVESSVVEPVGLKVSMVGAVELSSQEKLRQHVLRGHDPFDPHCLECQQGRGVSRAPRRSLRERILEVQVDFFFLGLVESKFKMILLRKVFSGLLGVTAVSENVQVTGQHLRQILAEFGLLETLEGPPVDFRTDAQAEVGTVLRRSGLPREYTVNKAGPQNHDTVGSVQRGVREIKEALAVLRLELAKAGLDLVDSLVAWEAASRYVTAMHNLHGKIQNTGKTGKELLNAFILTYHARSCLVSKNNGISHLVVKIPVRQSLQSPNYCVLPKLGQMGVIVSPLLGLSGIFPGAAQSV